jgi:hypothetical protein
MNETENLILSEQAAEMALKYFENTCESWP